MIAITITNLILLHQQAQEPCLLQRLRGSAHFPHHYYCLKVVWTGLVYAPGPGSLQASLG